MQQTASGQPFPSRAAWTVEPLISAAQLFPALEDAILVAKDEVFLAFRILDTRTRLRNPESLRRGLKTWGDLLIDARRRGCNVRLLLADFDPIVANTLHRETWRSILDLLERRAEIESTADLMPQMIAALHEGELGTLWRWIAWPIAKRKLHRLIEEKRSSSGDLRTFVHQSAGLRPMLRLHGRRVDITRRWPPRFWPGTHHQKIAVVDGSVAFAGGLDIDERRYEDPQHRRPAHETWHDVSLRVEGEAAVDLRTHFVSCWNREVPRFNARLTALGAPDPELPAPVQPIKATAPDTPDVQSSPPQVRVVRTLSGHSRSPFALGPSPRIREIAEAHVRQFKAARSCLYIETQFLRSVEIAEVLADQGRDNRGLHLIILLPAAPDDVAFEGSRGADAQHGEWLQVRSLDMLRDSFGDRIGVFTLVRQRSGEETNERDAIHGRQIVYLHSKVAIADSQHALVTSANLNGRSLNWDIEAGFEWHDPDAVRAFQQTLWRMHLGPGFTDGMLDDGATALAQWRAAAAAAADGAPDPVMPYVAFYPMDRARTFARRHFHVPDNLV